MKEGTIERWIKACKETTGSQESVRVQSNNTGRHEASMHGQDMTQTEGNNGRTGKADDVGDWRKSVMEHLIELGKTKDKKIRM
jgi:hypothetical protein